MQGKVTGALGMIHLMPLKKKGGSFRGIKCRRVLRSRAAEPREDFYLAPEKEIVEFFSKSSNPKASIVNSKNTSVRPEARRWPNHPDYVEPQE